MEANTRVLIPVKAFDQAKHRLAGALDPSARAELARRMAEGVIAAARHLPVAVVHDDPGVARWAEALGAQALRQRGEGLNGAVSSGVADLAGEGAERIIVAHSDLPLARDLTWVGANGGVTLVPDRRGDGTNVLCVPADLPFVFSYGEASFPRHLAEARRLGVEVRVVTDTRLSLDIDEPADLLTLDDPGLR